MTATQSAERVVKARGLRRQLQHGLRGRRRRGRLQAGSSRREEIPVMEEEEFAGFLRGRDAEAR